jgi:hypothetical protein
MRVTRRITDTHIFIEIYAFLINAGMSLEIKKKFPWKFHQEIEKTPL